MKRLVKITDEREQVPTFDAGQYSMLSGSSSSGLTMFNAFAASIQNLDRTRDFRVFALFLLPVLIFIIPPNGVLSTNEETYLGMAMLFPGGEPSGPNSALFGYMDHTFAFAFITKSLIGSIGYEATQIVGRLILAGVFALALANLFRALSLSVLEGLIALAVFYGFDQHILGGEWLFNGYEPKSLAYPAVLFGVAFTLQSRLVPATLSFAVATYFHFLVGGFWFAFSLIYALVDHRSFKDLATAVGMYVVVCIPILAVVVMSYLGDFVSAAGDSEISSRRIYKYVSQPHHTAPFSSAWELRKWAPGLASLFGIFGICAALATNRKGVEKKLATLNLIAISWLILAVVISLVDRPGYFAGFLMFRPSSVALLLFLCQLLLYLKNRFGHDLYPSRLGALILVSLVIAPTVVESALGPVYRVANDEADRSKLAAFVEDTAEINDVFLVDHRLMPVFLDFERKTGRPTLFMDVFIPPNSAQIITWYSRKQLRDRVFAGDCTVTPGYRVDFLIVDAARDLDCGRRVLTTDGFYVLRLRD